MNKKIVPLTTLIAGYGVHLLTATAAIIAIYTLISIQQGDIKLAFVLMGIAIIIDAIDGTLARALHVKTTISNIDGALLDNIVDYLNYVLTPCFLLMMSPNLLPDIWRDIIVCAILLASCYQFTQGDAKTKDNFFKGFPSYWNFAIFYMYVFHTSQLVNSIASIALIILVFVPIKYVYLSRMDYFTPHKFLRIAFLCYSALFGALSLMMLYLYPVFSPWCFYGVISFLIFYFAISIYRTYVPLT